VESNWGGGKRGYIIIGGVPCDMALTCVGYVFVCCGKMEEKRVWSTPQQMRVHMQRTPPIFLCLLLFSFSLLCCDMIRVNRIGYHVRALNTPSYSSFFYITCYFVSVDWVYQIPTHHPMNLSTCTVYLLHIYALPFPLYL